MSELQEVHDRISNLREDYVELKTTTAHNQAQLTEICRGMTRSIVRIEHELFGNGREGLVSRVTSLCTTQKTMVKAAWTLVGALLAVAGTVAASMF